MCCSSIPLCLCRCCSLLPHPSKPVLNPCEGMSDSSQQRELLPLPSSHPATLAPSPVTFTITEALAGWMWGAPLWGSVWKVRRKLIRMAVLSSEKSVASLYWTSSTIICKHTRTHQNKPYEMFSCGTMLSIFWEALNRSQNVRGNSRCEECWNRRVMIKNP